MFHRGFAGMEREDGFSIKTGASRVARKLNLYGVEGVKCVAF